MIYLRPYWRPHVSFRPKLVCFDEKSGRIEASTWSESSSESCRGWYVIIDGEVIALYAVEGDRFILQLKSKVFSITDDLHMEIHKLLFARRVILKQRGLTECVEDRSRGRFPLNLSRWIGSIMLDDWDAGDLLGDLYNWVTEPQLIPRDLFFTRLDEERKISEVG